MTTPVSEFVGAVKAALEMAKARVGAAALVTPLALCASALEAGAPVTAQLEDSLRAACAEALRLVARRELERSAFEKLGRVLDGSLDRPDLVLRAAFGQPPAPEILKAALDAPTVRRLERLRFEPPPEKSEPTLTANAVETDEAEPVEDLVTRADPPEPYVAAMSDPPIVELTAGGEPIRAVSFYGDVVERCADLIALLARHRDERPLSARAGEEVRILALSDAATATGALCVPALLGWWAQAIESPDPWKTWALAFCLARIDGGDALAALAHALSKLPADSASKAQAAADALALVPHPERLSFAEDLLVAPHPILRAAAIELLAQLHQLPPDLLTKHLVDPNPSVALAAVRSSVRTETLGPAQLAPLLDWMCYPEAAIAWEAARALLRHGRPEPYQDVLDGGPLSRTLGARLLDLLILCGGIEDETRVQTIVARSPLSPALLRAIGRFGAPRTWAFLAHHLADDDVSDAAADALELLFGERVPSRERLVAGAWRAAITSGAFNPAVRYRHGEPWRPSALRVDLERGRISRLEAERRIDELAVRAGLRIHAELRLWSNQASVEVAQLDGAITKGD